MTTHFNQYKDYKSLSAPIPMLGGTIALLGWFPYEKAQLSNECVKVPRTVYDGILEAIESIDGCEHILDNKIVLVFKDLVNFNTDDFALQLKDSFGKIGRWEDVIGYGGRELKTL